MHCKHCGFANGEDDHRCLRCGRRVSGVVIAAPPGYSGANALAVAMDPSATLDSTLDSTIDKTIGSDSQETPVQATMFPRPARNVIPFDRIPRQTTVRTTPAVPRPAPPATGTQRRTAHPPVEQARLDFIPAAPSKNRKLKTEVDAQVFCDAPVATPTHRFVAAAIDAAFVLIGFGVFVLSFVALGGNFGTGRTFWVGLGGTLVLAALFYGLVWAIAGRETAGMRFTDLQLITFDGFPLDGRSRALRFASSWLSFCSGGLGVFWALADEESLTWHDHISKTFPTIRETPRSFVKERR